MFTQGEGGHGCMVPIERNDVRRISVVGISGSGKTTIARRLATILKCPYLEVDAVYHQPGWRPLDDSSFRSILEEFTRGDSWIVDGSYRDWIAEGCVWQRADTVVWMRLPKGKVLRQLAARSVLRGISKRELWNGNRERLRHLFSLNPKRSIIADVWHRYASYDLQFAAYLDDPRFSHVKFVVLSNRAQADAWLRDVARAAESLRGSANIP